MGHAIAGLILFDGDISIYLGSYGDPKKGIHFRIGRLIVHFKYDFISWNHGLCVSSHTSESRAKNFIFILAGPFNSLLIAGLCLYFLITPYYNDYFRLVCFFLTLSSMIDFIQNIYPNLIPIVLHNGTTTFNDGQQLKNIIFHNRKLKRLAKLQEFYKENKSQQGAIYYEKYFKDAISPEVIRIGIVLYINNKEPQKAIELFTKLQSGFVLNATDHYNYGLALSAVKQYDKVNEAYSKAIVLFPRFVDAYNNRGYNNLILGNYINAILDFDICIGLDPHAFAYNNRGLAKIKLNQNEEGLKDIRRSLFLDDKNSYAYRNLGIYYFEKKEFQEAFTQFKKAKELNADTPEVDNYLLDLEKLGVTS